jgi:hypothetical protein
MACRGTGECPLPARCLDKLKPALFADHTVTVAEYAEAVAALEDPANTIVMPMAVAAWGERP